MKDKIQRLRQFTQEHRTALTFASGVATGTAVGAYIVVKAMPPGRFGVLNVFIEETPEQLVELMNKSGGFSVTNPETGQTLQVGVLPILEKMDL